MIYVLSDSEFSFTELKQWHAGFKHARVSLKDDFHSGLSDK